MVLFVIVAEILILIPSVAAFRRQWLSDRVMGAQMIALALTAAPGEQRPDQLERRLLAGVKGAQAIGVRGPGTRWLLTTAAEVPPEPSREIDLRIAPWWRSIQGAVRALFLAPSGPVRVIGDGAPGIEGVEWVELVLDEQPLQDATMAFVRNFVLVSLLAVGGTLGLLYLALHLLVVRPVQRLSANVTRFAADPEDASRILLVDGRTDEIGAAEQAVSRMQTSLAGALREKRHLADLGLAVSKINHELRNMLTTAQLIGDRLGEIRDPTVQRIAPRLISTLDRAIAYCAATLAYGRAGEREPRRERVKLAPIVADQVGITELSGEHPIRFESRVPSELEVDADAEQLGRALLNVIRNAVEALARAKTENATIVVDAARRGGTVSIRIADNGPGIPDRLRDRLFAAFQASERSGGTGLGLPVADELLRLHGGSIVLDREGPGAAFTITVPDRGAT